MSLICVILIVFECVTLLPASSVPPDGRSKEPYAAGSSGLRDITPEMSELSMSETKGKQVSDQAGPSGRDVPFVASNSNEDSNEQGTLSEGTSDEESDSDVSAQAGSQPFSLSSRRARPSLISPLSEDFEEWETHDPGTLLSAIPDEEGSDEEWDSHRPTRVGHKQWIPRSRRGTPFIASHSYEDSDEQEKFPEESSDEETGGRGLTQIGHKPLISSSKRGVPSLASSSSEHSNQERVLNPATQLSAIPDEEGSDEELDSHRLTRVGHERWIPRSRRGAPIIASHSHEDSDEQDNLPQESSDEETGRDNMSRTFHQRSIPGSNGSASSTTSSSSESSDEEEASEQGDLSAEASE